TCATSCTRGPPPWASARSSGSSFTARKTGRAAPCSPSPPATGTRAVDLERRAVSTRRSPTIGAIMNRTRIAPLLLPLLVVAACQTDKKPLIGFDKQPDGSILQINNLNAPNGMFLTWPVFAMDRQETFRIRLNGQDLVYSYIPGYYDFQEWTMGPGWTGAQSS